MTTEPRVILDLCSGSGEWSRPYKEAGYVVIQLDLPVDIRLLAKLNYDIHGILAAPPCTMFANSGSRWPRSEAQMLDALSVVDACMRAIVIYQPNWWALENPIGKLTRYLGPPRYRFHPCYFGDPYTKYTNLWGTFALPLERHVEPIFGSFANQYHGGNSAERSVTPSEFCQSIFHRQSLKSSSYN